MSDEATTDTTAKPSAKRKRRRYVPAVGPRLRKVLFVVFGLFALLAANAVYLGSITFLESLTGEVYQNWFYLYMFFTHLLLGALIIIPVIVYGIGHIKNAHDRVNRRAVRVGYALFTTALLLLFSGIVLTRLEGIIEVKDPEIRSIAYWLHVATPLVAAWLFILHRLAGTKIKWKVGAAWATAAGVFAAVMLLIQAQDPRQWNVEGNPEGDQYFFPSLARTLTGDFIPASNLMNDQYCKECHEDTHTSWSGSVHRFSSFNNPVYLFSVRNIRDVSMEKDGNVNRARFCAGCHDPVPFFSGQFNDPNYDDVGDPTAHAGVTCSVCHSITHVNSPRGNSDFTIDAPIHYPFMNSDNETLAWLNQQLVKSKPEFHKKTFLKPLHKTTEFCGTCHKVHIPVELNDYKWLRGQNHYDTFLLSGVSGIGVSSFYYPEVAEPNCNNCHMPLQASEDFGAQDFDDSGELTIHDHLFPSANAAMPMLVEHENAAEVVEAHRAFNEGVMRVDIFGVKDGGSISGPLTAPVRPSVPALESGKSYLIEAVIRTVKMGHTFTQGTTDSNEIWMEVIATSGGRIVGRSGQQAPNGEVDPWSHFVNQFVLDRDGFRIDRRNVEAIFAPLYNNQIPPGAADVVHYRLDVPPDVTEPITVEIRLNYRKFDTALMQHIYDADWVNDLPIIVLAEDTVTFPVAGGMDVANEPTEIPEWQRWNDYGIGLLRKRGQGELRQAEEAFKVVQDLGRPDGPLNLARVYFREGRVGRDAPEALRTAAAFDPPAPQWTVLWFSGLENKQNGRFEEAIRDFEQIVEGGFEQAAGKGFDFSRDYRLLNELGQTYYERARQERGKARREQREVFLRRAVDYLDRTLELDPENLTAHWSLYLIHTDLGDAEKAAKHSALHATYKPDDNARDKAIAEARRRYPAANKAAEAVVIYELNRSVGQYADAETEMVANER